MRSNLALYIATACWLGAVTLLGICVYAEEAAPGSPAMAEASDSFATPEETAGPLKTFSSYEELERYVRESSALAREFDFYVGVPGGGGVMVMEDRVRAMQAGPQGAAGAAAGAPADYSRTNVQVEGVDEADIVKTDGRFLYILTGAKVVIVQAYPAGEARVLSEIEFEGRPVEAFINGDRLVVFGTGSRPDEMFTRVYDVGDRTKPVLKRDITARGHYVTARMIDDYVYVVLNLPLHAGPGAEKIALPEVAIDGHANVVPPNRIYYFDCPDYHYQYTMLMALNVRDDARAPTEKTFLTGVSQHVFASRQHVYLTNVKTPNVKALSERFVGQVAALVPAEVREKIERIWNSQEAAGQRLPEVGALLEDYVSTLDEETAASLANRIQDLRQEWHREMARERDRTVIHKLTVSEGSIEYVCWGEVPGRVLNQFSMDEHRGFFRVATTTEGFLFPERPATRNNIFVLDENLQVVGKLTGLALSERIYAARFMGDRAYLVTFRRVDPLFVVDLQDPRQPRVLGQLKIPGYSDYLHPYDENHLIGIGKEVPDPERQMSAMVPPVREQGVKIALFDVTDPRAPKEISKYVVENPYSDSPALRDHKAVLFSRSKNLLVIPISVHPPYRIMPEKLPPDGHWAGAYIFDISLEDGIRLKGKIVHAVDEGIEAPAGSDAGGVPVKRSFYPVRRALYIEDILYTVSEPVVKMHRLPDLRELARVPLL